MRISREAMVSQSVQRLRSRLEQLDRVQGQLSSGKRILKPSDDPGRMSTGMTLRAAQRAREQEERNISDARRWAGTTDAKLQEAVTILHRVRDLAVRAASSIGQPERDGIATEMLSLREELVAVANSSLGGQGLFAGSTAGPAVSESGGVWSYGGDGTPVTRRVADGDVVTVSVTAEEVFGLGAAQDVFTMLTDLAARVTSGDVPGVGAGIGEVDEAAGRVLEGLARIGAAGGRIERVSDRNVTDQLSLRGQLAEIEDVDLAEAVMELQLQEVSYQATLGSMARLMQPSLLDFLR